MMLRCLSLSSGLRERSTPWPTKKASPSHMSVMTATCRLECVSEGHVKILPKTNKQKNKKQWSVLPWCGLQGLKEQSCLAASDGGQKWLHGLTRIGHLHMQIALPSAPSGNKQFFKNSNSNFTGRPECPRGDQGTDVLSGDLWGPQPPSSVMSLDQLHCKNAWEAQEVHKGCRVSVLSQYSSDRLVRKSQQRYRCRQPVRKSFCGFCIDGHVDARRATEAGE